MLLSGVKQATGLLSSSSTRRAAASVLPHISSSHTPARYSKTLMSASGDTLGTTVDPAAAASEPEAAAAAGLAVDAAAEPAAKKVKRNVALHVGYVGTAYTGAARGTAAQLLVNDDISEASCRLPPATCHGCTSEHSRVRSARRKVQSEGCHALYQRCNV